MAQGRDKEFKYMKALSGKRNHTMKHMRWDLKGKRKENFRSSSKRGLCNLRLITAMPAFHFI